MADVVERRSDALSVTPMMKQYMDVKAEYEDYILFYRLGDFYECFFEDAMLVSRVLELTLTGRECGSGKRAAMCGVPFHKSDVYVGRLVEKGYKVAICEQVEDPKSAAGLVKREVTRVVTPGTVTDASLLAEGKNNYLCSVCAGTSVTAIAFADISTGELYATFSDRKDSEGRIINELGAFSPAEVIVNLTEEEIPGIFSFLRERCSSLVNGGQKRLFGYEKCRDIAKDVFGEEAAKLNNPELIMAVGALLLYIRETQKTSVSFAREISVYSRGQFLDIDVNTRRNLELSETMRSGEKRGSLLWVLDKTKTGMGARMLRNWLLKPLLNPAHISRRQGAVDELLKNQRLNDDLAEILSHTLDIERLTAKAVYGTASAKDLRAIYLSILGLQRLKELLRDARSDRLREITLELDTMEDLCDLLGRAIVDDPPHTVREGGMIRTGFSSDVDYYRSIKENSKEIMASLEEREKEETGIRTLKVDYNKVFGYYIEVSKSFINEVPARFIRKQTLTNCERYITQELKEIESAVFSADDKLVGLEYELFMAVKNAVVDCNERLCSVASLLAEIDVYRSLAEVARRNSYSCPEVNTSGKVIIKDGRHPVVEKFVKDSYFVPNDTYLDNGQNRMMIITGPNMAGKSTYMRQVAVIVIMAQIGSFVPAREAEIGIVDKIFTRVGASDDLASGQSTFMLEMNEVANILKNATKNSLIIYDEVGRGTSTFDGMAIARAVVEYTNSSKVGAKTLFATHYHELTVMEDEIGGIVNYNIAAKKRGDGIIFLRKIVRGGTDDSYGIEVAKLAGVPNEVVKRAKEILSDIEKGQGVSQKIGNKSDKPEREPDLFSGLVTMKESEAAEKIRALDINTTTPIEAMNLLFELKKLLGD